MSVEQSLQKAKLYKKKGKVTEAKILYEKILQSFPQNTRALEGLESLEKFNNKDSKKNPPQEIINQLVKLLNSNQFSHVYKQIKSLLLEYPNSFFLWNILGISAVQNGILDEAIIAFNKSILLEPNYVETYNNLGNVLREKKMLEESIKAFKKAISLKPDYADAYSNMGVAFKDLGKLDNALEAYKKAISLRPNFASYHNNIGNTLKDLGNLGEAIQAYEKAISLKPDFAEAHKNLSFAYLNKGLLKKGFEEYEWRWETLEFLSQQRNFRQPMWDGKQHLDDKRILIWCEQGIGDTLMWSSYLSLIDSISKHCVLECQEKLIPLLKRSFPNIEIKCEDKSIDLERDDIDFHLPMGNIYKNFIKEISKNNKVKSYLIPDPARVKFWKERLKSLGNGPFIGISWKSRNMSIRRLPNYCQISELYPILNIPEVTFINLQYIDFEYDLKKLKEDLGVIIHNFDDLDHYDNIDDVAALCSALDVIVSTKTTVPIISAGVGTSTKLANWKQSPWNNILLNPKGPSINIYERNTLENWDKTFNLISQDILKFKKNGVYNR
jgi:tetratricopeptide (TPR) repeat protein